MFQASSSKQKFMSHLLVERPTSGERDIKEIGGMNSFPFSLLPLSCLTLAVPNSSWSISDCNWQESGLS